MVNYIIDTDGPTEYAAIRSSNLENDRTNEKKRLNTLLEKGALTARDILAAGIPEDFVEHTDPGYARESYDLDQNGQLDSLPAEIYDRVPRVEREEPRPEKETKHRVAAD